MKKPAVWLAGLLLVLAPAARGAGFLIYEHGAAAMAMGGAFTGLAKDPSALWHNPAGLAWLDGTQVMAGATLVFPRGSMTLADYPGSPSFNQVHKVFYPPNVYLTHKFSDRVVAGLGVTAPFGLGIEWPDPETFPWRYWGTASEMKTFFINPSLAVKLGPRLSAGLGVSFVYSKLRQSVTQIFDVGGKPFDVPSDLDVDGTAFGWNAGLLYKGDGFSLGLTYRSRITLKYKGTATFHTSLPIAPGPVEGTAETSFHFPDIVTMGLSLQLTKKLVWAADLHYVLWTVFDSYTVHIEVPDLGLSEDVAQTPDWGNSYVARTGLEFQAAPRLALRAGFIYDRTPQPASSMDTSLPDADRLAFTAGFGYKIGKFVVDVAYHNENFRKRTSERADMIDILQGTFKTRAHLVGANLTYRF